ncbi:MAG TPA: 2-dehydropantoate 2-reductase [Acidimicrobiia bacterium]|nr:2-dehydropantoate 2-reductase [Acidimicrobiia bacterium]
MRYIVYGAGAIGGLVGGRLAQAGHDVALIARGAHADAMRTHGLRIDAPGGSTTVRIPVATDPADLDLTPTDTVLLAVKGQDTAGALARLVACAPESIAIACLQNGVDNERVALRYFARVYAVPVMCPASHLEPGVVEASSAPTEGIFDVGRYPTGADEHAQTLSDAFGSATFASRVVADIMRWKYTKLLMNVGNAVEALCGPGRESLDVVLAARAEARRVFDTAGIAYASDDEDKERRGDRISIQPVNGRRRGGGSSWQSLARGTGAIEADHLNGEVVLLGRLHGVPTPLNERLQHAANRAARERWEPGALSIDALLADLPAGTARPGGLEPPA